MVDRITEILEMVVKPEKLLNFLRFYCHPQNPEKRGIDEDVLQSTSSIYEVMQSLVPKHINYGKTELLEAIIERFELKEAESVLQQYRDDFPNVPDESLGQARWKRSRVKSDDKIDSTGTIKQSRRFSEDTTGIDWNFDALMEQRANHFSSKGKGCLRSLLEHIPKLVLKRECSKLFTWQLTTHMIDWKVMTPPFGISELAAEGIPYWGADKNFVALHCWQQSHGNATYENLIATLLAFASFDLAKAALEFTPGMHNVISLGWDYYFTRTLWGQA